MTLLQAAAGLVVAAGASVTPDFDHPSAIPSHAFPLVTKPIAKAVNWVGKKTEGPAQGGTPGHRAITHSLACTAVVAVSVRQMGFEGKWWTISIVGLMALLAVRVLGPKMIRHSAIMSAGAAALIGFAVWRYVPPGAWLWEAATVGVAAHIASDMLSAAGVQLFWPWHRRIRVPGDLVPFDSKRERRLASASLLAVCYLGWGLIPR